MQKLADAIAFWLEEVGKDSVEEMNEAALGIPIAQYFASTSIRVLPEQHYNLFDCRPIFARGANPNWRADFTVRGDGAKKLVIEAKFLRGIMNVAKCSHDFLLDIVRLALIPPTIDAYFLLVARGEFPGTGRGKRYGWSEFSENVLAMSEVHVVPSKMRSGFIDCFGHVQKNLHLLNVARWRTGDSCRIFANPIQIRHRRFMEGCPRRYELRGV